MPHFSRLTAHKGTARRAPTASPTGQPQGLPPRPHSSQRHGTPCPYGLTPHSSLLTPLASLLTPHSSLLTPTTSLLSPHSTPSFRACPGICLAVAACTLPPAPHGARARARHAVPLRPHSSLLRPHSSLLSPHSTPSFRACPGICLAVAACTLPPAPHGARARARHAVPLRPHPQGNHKGCPYDLTPHKGTARRATTA